MPLTRRTIGISAALLTAVALTGCSASVGSGANTVSSDTVASLAEDALEAEVGIRPSIDCGEEEFEVVEGVSRDCTLTAPDGSEIGATVTITDVDGIDYVVDVQVDDAP